MATSKEQRFCPVHLQLLNLGVDLAIGFWHFYKELHPIFQRRSEVIKLLQRNRLQEVCKLDTKIRIGALISGSGTNVQAVIDSCRNAKINGQIVFVGSDNPDAEGLSRARKSRKQRRMNIHNSWPPAVGIDPVNNIRS